MRRNGGLRRWIWVLLLLGLIGVGLGMAFWPQPVPVDTVTVQRGPLTLTVNGEGEARIRDVYVISTPVAGRAFRIAANAGDSIEAGATVLARIAPTDPAFLDQRARAQAESEVERAEAGLALAEADLARGQAELDFALAELNRIRQLFERGHVARALLDHAMMDANTRRAAVASQEAAVRMRRFELQAARAALIEPQADTAGVAGASTCCIEVRSPVDGVVLQVLRRSEGIVSAGEPLLEIGDLRNLEVTVDLLSTDAIRVEPGQSVTIEGWGGREPAPGLVRRVEPFGFTKVSALGIEEQRVNVLVDFAGPPEDWPRLGHGYRVFVRIVVWHRPDAISLPIGAVFRPAAGQAAGEWGVYVVEDGRARLRPVTVGVFTERAVEIVEGVAEGDIVLLHPSDRIRDGVRVAERQLE
jgi:HlyD family secretion protein